MSDEPKKKDIYICPNCKIMWNKHHKVVKKEEIQPPINIHQIKCGVCRLK